MRNLKFLINFVCAFILLGAMSFAQTPEKMSYQAIVRNANNEVLQSTNIGIKISVLIGSETGTVAYSEVHTAKTNANGLISLSVGEGSNPTGSFAGINWGDDIHFLKMEVDPTGGTSYSIISNHQLLSVPYALYAKMAGDIPDLDEKIEDFFVAYLLDPTAVGALKAILGVDNLADVATTGDYEDLSNTPNIGDEVLTFFEGYLADPASLVILKTALGIDNLADVATTGSYNDLTDQPSITDTVNSFLTTYLTNQSNADALKLLMGFSTVATSGNYNDLSNRPTIPANLSDLNRDLNWDTSFTNEIQDLIFNMAKDSILLSLGGKGIHVDDLFNTFDLSTVGLSQFINDEGYLTPDILLALVSDPAIKTIIVDFMMNEIDTNQYLQDKLKEMVTGDPLRWMNVALDIAQEIVANEQVRDLVIETLRQSNVVKFVLDSMLADGLDAFVADPMPYLTKAYVAIKEEIENHPEIQQGIIDAITDLKNNPFVKEVWDSIVSKATAVMATDPDVILAKINDVINIVVAQNPTLPGKIITYLSTSPFVGDMLTALMGSSAVESAIADMIKSPAIQGAIEDVANDILDKVVAAIVDDPNVLFNKANDIINAVVAENGGLKNDIINFLSTNAFVGEMLAALMGSSAVTDVITDAIEGAIATQSVQDALMASIGSQLAGGIGAVGTSTFIPVTATNTSSGISMGFVSFSLPPIIASGTIQIPISPLSPSYTLPATVAADVVYQAGICWTKIPGASIIDGLITPNYWTNPGLPSAFPTQVLPLASLAIPADISGAITVIQGVDTKMQSVDVSLSGKYYVRPYVITKNAGRVYGPEIEVTLP